MQNRLRDYKEPVTSFEHNLFNLGLHNAGRYCGFDTIVQQAAVLEFNLLHTGTGVSYKNTIDALIGPAGVLVTPQGVIIQETEPITGLEIETNLGNLDTRYDLIYCEHNFAVVAGGTVATYHVLKGPMGNPIKPVLTDPFKQTPIGIIEIPPGAESVDECTYIKFKSPDSGDGEDARLTTPNAYKAIQQFNKSANDLGSNSAELITGGHVAHLWDLENDGNLFVISPNNGVNTFDGFRIKEAELQQGTRIYIHASSNITFRESRHFENNADLFGQGYRGLTLNPGLGNVLVGNGGGAGVYGVQAAVGESWEYEFVFLGTRWYLTKIGGAGVASQIPRGMVMDWFGDVAANFDDTGLGVNLMAGWAITNSLNGTPDLRGKGRVTATDVPANGAQSMVTADLIAAGLNPESYLQGAKYTFGGLTKFLIAVANLPSYQLPITDPGHHHTQTGINALNSGTGGSGANSGTSDTGIAYTGIQVFSGGGGQRLTHYTPTWFTVTVMKL